jgi:methenyltetrahydrofolate cyclohydrolase
MLIDNIQTYCEKLGSTSPAPGGGSACGLILSMGASAAEKAMRFSFEEQDNDFTRKVVLIRLNGLKLSDEDQIQFENWANARKLQKDTDEQKKYRNEKVNYYASECAKVPYNIGKNAVDLLNVIEMFLPKCSKWLISDAAVGASFALASLESSIFNIKINLPYVKDEDLKNELKTFVEENMQPSIDLKNKILIFCDKLLSK